MWVLIYGLNLVLVHSVARLPQEGVYMFVMVISVIKTQM